MTAELKKSITPLYRITLILLSVLAVSNIPVRAQSQYEQIEEILNTYHDLGLFNGSVLVAKNGEILFKGGFGDADMSWNLPNTTDTKFRIASTTKQFTAALILRLAEEGKLETEGRVTEYLPDYPSDQGDRITLHHLLSHTSGIPGYTTPEFMAEQVRDPFTPGSLVSLFSSQKLLFEPGTAWSYSNSGYILLGAIIEAVTGLSYQKALDEYLLDPSDLSQTGYDNYAEIKDHEATGYISTPGGYELAPYLNTSVPYSAGMLYSTVEDLFKWDQMLYGDTIFKNRETRSMLFDHHASIPEAMVKRSNLPPHYGYGWFTGQIRIGNKLVQVTEHGGNMYGFTAGFWRMVEERNTVIILDNSGSGEIRDLGHALIAVLYDEPHQFPKKPITSELYKIINEKGFKAAKEQYMSWRNDHRNEYNFEESALNTLGYYYLQQDEAEKAIEVFKLNLQTFPRSANGYDSLGEAYLKAGMQEQSLESYRKSLELNPGNSNALEVLEKYGVNEN